MLIAGETHTTMAANSQWLLTTVNAVRELMIERLGKASVDEESRREAEMVVEELDVMWEELQGQAELLMRENQRYAEFFDYAPDAYLMTDAGGNIREANRAAAELLGAPREQVMRRPLSSFLPEEERVAFLSRFVGVLVDNLEKGAWQGHLLPAGGQPLEALFSVRAVPLGRSGVAGLCWLIRTLD
jgi:PAS domain S-box-containing protein